MFMLYYEASTKKVHAINGSGTAPAALTLERCLADLEKAKPASSPPPAAEAAAGGCVGAPKTFDIPPGHPHCVTVPGAAAGWCDAVSKFGSGAVTLAELMEPAALLAEEGFPVSPITAHHWGLCAYQLETGPNKGGGVFDHSQCAGWCDWVCRAGFGACITSNSRIENLDSACVRRPILHGYRADKCCGQPDRARAKKGYSPIDCHLVRYPPTIYSLFSFLTWP